MFNRRRRYNGDVATLLPAFGIDLEEAGVMKVLGILDAAWADNYSIYEAALVLAYGFVFGLYEKKEFQRAGGFNPEVQRRFDVIVTAP